MEEEFKVVTIGESGVGKTALLTKFATGEFQSEINPTVGSATLVGKIQIDKKTVKLNLWDTAGQEKFNSLLPIYFRNLDAVLFVFDISKGLENTETLYHSVEKDIPQNANFYLIGNKSDLVDTHYDTSAFEDWAQHTGMTFLKTSAKTGENIHRLFTQIANDCVSNANYIAEEIDYTKEIIGADTPKGKGGCCR